MFVQWVLILIYQVDFIMMANQKVKYFCVLLLSLISICTHADGIRPDSHAPIGVMGDHTHNTGEWMIFYRYMTMDMDGNLRGDSSVSPEEIVTGLSNPYAPPPTVRVVPVSMTTSMQMIGAMYAPSDTVTLMGMVNLLEKEMDHVTFIGMTGTNRLGTFTSNSSGVGDTKVSALWSLKKEDGESVHLNLGLSIPTGNINEEGEVLAPTGVRLTLRLPYAMQLGSGTYDLEPGVTYTRRGERAGWGVQYLATLRLGENDENYTLGDVHRLTAWGSYRFSGAISGALRLSYRGEDSIDGRDALIAAPVQTANPDNYGGDRIDFAVSINFATPAGHRFALEYETPVKQDVNGIQMEMQPMLTVGYQFAF